MPGADAGFKVRTLAERASVARATLHKLEKGDPGVAMGIYATVCSCLACSIV